MQGFVELENDCLSLRLSTTGGAVVDGRTRDGRRFLRRHDDGAFEVLRSACFPLFPIGNRVEGNGFELAGKSYRFKPNTAEPNYIHGDGWLAKWNVADASATRVRLVFEQPRPVNSPYIYRAVQTITLDGATVTLALSVTNLGNETLPFGIGFHPYFPRTEATRFMAPAAAWWTEREGYLPGVRTPIPDSADFKTPRRLPRRRLNNCFEGWSGQARIVWPEVKLAADIAADPVFSRYMLYAPEDDASFFCLEPMSHTPNALALAGPDALHLLASDETLAGAFSITVSDCEDFQ
ncbi:aldose 1-epimerase [Aminobacter lissarensis]|uniref:Aldose 1-epimerase n=1 Tax=Aminobacter carboxidus TaxID=376165 RepID=A0A8E1WHI6_9HYPH|nr:aldose 1-epimerase [Aminobacter lissarensis]MBB6468014.1 aldose 1-epimerase [Aminobacter lissarensis]